MAEPDRVGLGHSHQIDDGLKRDDAGVLRHQVDRLAALALLQQVRYQLLGRAGIKGSRAKIARTVNRFDARRRSTVCSGGSLLRMFTARVWPEQGVVRTPALDPEKCSRRSRRTPPRRSRGSCFSRPRQNRRSRTPPTFRCSRRNTRAGVRNCLYWGNGSPSTARSRRVVGNPELRQ